MSRYFSYLHSAKEILLAYNGEEPFSLFIKAWFSRNKKFGSADRKQVSHLCYCFFRLGKTLPGIATEEKILLALFFCSSSPVELLEQLKPEWNKNSALSFDEKKAIAGYPVLATEIFSWADKLSDETDKGPFLLSHLVQPDLFLRLRPGKEERVKQKLLQAGIPFTTISRSCLALPNSSKMDTVIELNKEAVIQDYSSQRVGDLLLLINDLHPLAVWDCCAASGGKSIMAKDILGNIDLTVSDVRQNSLINLKKRFIEAGITHYKSMVADLTNPVSKLLPDSFQLIIADVPCTGSGTWGRTPEQLLYFDDKKIAEYASLQKKIISNTLPALQPGGYYLYITCSVFKKENEEAVNFMQEKFMLEVIQQQLLKGYTNKGDSMFAALLKKRG